MTYNTYETYEIASNITMAAAVTPFSKNSVLRCCRPLILSAQALNCFLLSGSMWEVRITVNSISFRGVKCVRSSEINKDHIMEGFEC